MQFILWTGPPAGAQRLAAGAIAALQEAGEEAEEPEGPFEAEFVASSVFQSGTAAYRMGSPLTIEGHFFGVDDNEIGILGMSWMLSYGEFRLIPGIGWAFGSENRPAPVLTVRWSYESERWVTQGLFLQSLRAYVPDRGREVEAEGHQTEAVVRHASILDGIHASAIIGPAEIGPMIEHTRYREDNEWKGGLRVAWRLGRGFKLVSQVVGPDTEVRGGLAWEP